MLKTSPTSPAAVNIRLLPHPPDRAGRGCGLPGRIALDGVLIIWPPVRRRLGQEKKKNEGEEIKPLRQRKQMVPSEEPPHLQEDGGEEGKETGN